MPRLRPWIFSRRLGPELAEGRRPPPWIYILILTIATLIQLTFLSTQHAVNDFCQDYLAATRASRSQSVYQLFPVSLCWKNLKNIEFQYPAHPPTSILFFIPFILIPLKQATFVWDILNIFLNFVCLFLTIYIATRKFNFRLSTIFFSLSSIWLTTLLALTNRNLFFALLILISLSLININRRPKISGLLIGLAALLKLWPLLFLGLGFINKKYLSFLLIGLLTIITGCFVSIIFLGPKAFSDYFYKTIPFEEKFVTHPNNISLTSTIYKSTQGISILNFPPVSPPTQKFYLFSFLFIVTSIIFICLRNLSKLQEPKIYFSSVLVIVFTFFPLTWDGSALLLLLPAAIIFHLIFSRQTQPSRTILIYISLGLLLLWSPQSVELLSRFFTNFPPISSLVIIHYLLIFLLSSTPLLLIISQFQLLRLPK